ncbi:MAG TPA: HAMP domain-containing sensor histidine kinase, partial [Luteimonas sp.]|nr:HAMP domain-containing sensor histidine kinase [Luteimonas sp.]
QQMVRLIDDLLDVGRITSGKIKLDFEPVRLAGVVTDAIEMVQPLLEQHRHALSVSLDDRPVWVMGDRARLLQVVSNLLNNAAKYTPPQGRIDVAVRNDGNRVEIRVKDNGPGIAPAHLKDIFNLFVQVEHRPDNGGLGLGLSLVQQLVTLHRGEVSVFSTGEAGKGSEFVVSLPTIATPAD